MPPFLTNVTRPLELKLVLLFLPENSDGNTIGFGVGRLVCGPSLTPSPLLADSAKSVYWLLASHWGCACSEVRPSSLPARIPVGGDDQKVKQRESRWGSERPLGLKLIIAIWDSEVRTLLSDEDMGLKPP